MLQLIWWLVEPEKLSTLAYAVINDPAATIFVSTATGWELATKVRLGKLPGAEGLLVETVVSSDIHDIRRSWTRPLLPKSPAHMSSTPDLLCISI
jgi:PIN domain nuclease of toxin-antitoxin system